MIAILAFGLPSVAVMMGYVVYESVRFGREQRAEEAAHQARYKAYA